MKESPCRLWPSYLSIEGAELLPAPLPPKRVLELYRQMTRSRRLDERMLLLQRQGRLGTFAPALGQEAAQAGSAGALAPGDWLVPSFRESAAALARGIPIRSILLYAMGLEEGSACPEDGRTLPPSIPVAGQTAHAVGLAWASRLRGRRDAALVYLGDGATSQGLFHESMNFAGVLGLGVVFFCQNNQWAISTPRALQTASETLAQKARAHGFEGVQVDGNDLFAVHTATAEALSRARAGDGPELIEAVTYRRGPHTTADDPRVYRSEEEELQWAARDPVERVRRWLSRSGRWDVERQENLEREIDAEIEKATREAEAARDSADPLRMFDHVYARMPGELRRQRERAARELKDRAVIEGAVEPRGSGGAAAVGRLEEAPEDRRRP